MADKFELDPVYLGKSKDVLDQIDLSLTIDAAITLFVPFLRYHNRSAEQILPSVHNVFAVLMPDPMPGDDGHYKPYMDLLGTKTDETRRPSLQKVPKRTKTSRIYCKCPACKKF